MKLCSNLEVVVLGAAYLLHDAEVVGLTDERLVHDASGGGGGSGLLGCTLLRRAVRAVLDCLEELLGQRLGLLGRLCAARR